MRISTSNLTIKIKDKIVLNNININLSTGHLVVLLGANGAGKTTLIKSLMGFIKPSSGDIFYDNCNIKNISIKNRAKLVSYVPQTHESNLKYKVNDLVAMGNLPYTSFLSPKDQTLYNKIEEVLTKLNILALKNRYIDEISGGECRLAYLARAIVQDTPWTLLDEPTANLDFEKQHKFLTLLKSIIINNNKGAIMSIHDPSLACKYADVLVLLKNGQLLEIINKNEKDAYIRLEICLKQLYGTNIAFEDTSNGKVLTWKEN